MIREANSERETMERRQTLPAQPDEAWRVLGTGLQHKGFPANIRHPA